MYKVKDKINCVLLILIYKIFLIQDLTDTKKKTFLLFIRLMSSDERYFYQPFVNFFVYFTEIFPPRQSVACFVNAEFGQDDLIMDQF